MSKKKRTKKEKIIASLRRELHSSHSISSSEPSSSETAYSSAMYSYKGTTLAPSKIIPSHPIAQPTRSYAYVIQDAKKTLFIISSLVVLNILLFILIQKHIVPINF